jgi:hypothetical protein
MVDSEKPDPQQRLLDELWQLIQDSKRQVEETKRLAAAADRVRRKMQRESKGENSDLDPSE